MSRLFVPASLLAAMLGIVRLDLSAVQAADPVPAGFIEEAGPTPAAAIATDSGDFPASEPADKAGPDELNSPNEGASEPDKLDAAAEAEAESELEVIRERYPNRAVKIEREVSQDENGNYVNDGFWRMWDQKGTLMAEGNYRNGQREGVWNRWYRAGDVDLFSKAPYNGYQGPFISQATFVNGKLDGNWVIYDGKQRKVSQWEFVAGERHGRSTAWFANGHKMREIEYANGEIDGQLIEWAADGKLLTKETFQHGRRLAGRTDRDTAGGKKTEGVYLFAKEVVKTPDDWWNAKLAEYMKTGKDEKHGPWVSWYPSGQRHAEGEYRNDVQVGKFVWWYANGQKALEGAYTDGEQEGKWVWWHENGQKSILGEYTKGHPSGRWTWWNQDGKVARATEMENGAGEVVNVPEKPQAHPPARQGSKPAGPTYPSRR